VVFVVPAATLAFLGQTDAVEALAQPIPGRRWPQALTALSVRNYRLYLSAQAISTTGLWMQRIAQDWLVLELTGSVAAVGVAVALQFLPVLIFGLFGGVLADRYPKRRLLMITQTTAASWPPCWDSSP
jgi:MFS family permease